MMIMFIHCSSTQNGTGEPAPVIGPQEGAELCDEACEAMTKLTNASGGIGCEVAEPFPVQDGGTVTCGDGAMCMTCEDWCMEQHANGVAWNTACIVDLPNCDGTACKATCEEVDTVCNNQ
jgi:hypothetical protein